MPETGAQVIPRKEDRPHRNSSGEVAEGTSADWLGACTEEVVHREEAEACEGATQQCVDEGRQEAACGVSN